MIEYQLPAPQLPGLAVLHGYVAAFGPTSYKGCVYYMYAENSEVASPTS